MMQHCPTALLAECVHHAVRVVHVHNVHHHAVREHYLPLVAVLILFAETLLKSDINDEGACIITGL